MAVLIGPFASQTQHALIQESRLKRRNKAELFSMIKFLSKQQSPSLCLRVRLGEGGPKAQESPKFTSLFS